MPDLISTIPNDASYADDEFLGLAVRYYQEDLDEPGTRELDRQLRGDVVKRDRFVALGLQSVLIPEALRIEAEEQATTIPLDALPRLDVAPLDDLSERPTHQSGFRPTSPRFWIAVSLLTAFFLGGLYFLVGQGWRPTRMAAQDQQKDEQEHPSQQIAALVAGAVNCQWAKGSPVLDVGDRAVVGKRYELADGLMKLVFGRQARCLLEGPVAFRVVSADVVRVEQGRLAAEVPASAKGFAVRTPWANVIDLGTEFGVEVEEGGPLAIHVFQGKVRMEPTVEGPSAMTIAAGQSMRLLSRGTGYTVTQGEATPLTFRRQMPIGPGGGYAESRFDESTEGWVVTVDGHRPALYKQAPTPHGGYLETYDERNRIPQSRREESFYFSFVAPKMFCGDHSAAYGKWLTCELRIRGGFDEPKPRYCELHGADVVLGFPLHGPPNNDSWTQLKVPLRDDPQWVRLDLKTKPAAQPGMVRAVLPQLGPEDLAISAAEPGMVKAVLQDLRCVVIPGEFYLGTDEVVGLDNVVLGAEE